MTPSSTGGAQISRERGAPCTTGSRRTRRPRLRRPSLITYELGQKHREPRICAARRARLARAVAARRRAPARSCCRCSPGRCWRRRCGRGGATSRCWLVQLGGLGTSGQRGRRSRDLRCILQTRRWRWQPHVEPQHESQGVRRVRSSARLSCRGSGEAGQSADGCSSRVAGAAGGVCVCLF